MFIFILQRFLYWKRFFYTPRDKFLSCLFKEKNNRYRCWLTYFLRKILYRKISYFRDLCISFLILDIISHKPRPSGLYITRRWMRVLICTQSLDERIRNIPVEYHHRRWHDFNVPASNIFSHALRLLYYFYFRPRRARTSKPIK